MRPRTIAELNQVIVRRDPKRAEAFLAAANCINDLQGSLNPDYAMGDLLLAKLNFLGSGKRPRKRPQRRTTATDFSDDMGDIQE